MRSTMVGKVSFTRWLRTERTYFFISLLLYRNIDVSTRHYTMRITSFLLYNGKLLLASIVSVFRDNIVIN